MYRNAKWMYAFTTKIYIPKFTLCGYERLNRDFTKYYNKKNKKLIQIIFK